MDKKEKQGLIGTSVGVVKIVLLFLMLFNGFIFIYYGEINRSDTIDPDSFLYVSNWTVTEDSADLYSVVSTLPNDIEDNQFFFFDLRKDAAVYINGELRKDFIESRDVNIPGGTVKKFFMMVPLKASDSGAEIRIDRMTTLMDEHTIPVAFISTRAGALSYLVHNEGIAFILATIVLIFSFVVIVVSFVLKFCYKLKIDMMYGALGIFVISSWIVTDSFLFPYIFGVYHVNGLVSYMLCHMLPFAPAIYLNSLQKGRYKRSMSIIMLASCVSAIMWPVLHFTGVVPYYATRTIMNAILVLFCISAIAVLVADAIRGKIGTYRYTYLGFMGFLVCGIVELIFLFVESSTEGAIPMVVGLAFLLVFIVIQQVDDLRKINQEKQHAIDISEAKTRFLASMSHEIRTPINAILGMNEMILRENDDKVVAEYSRNIQSSGKMLLMLVNDVLDFSKIEAGKLEIHEAHFLMSDMLYDVISLVKERADEKSLALETVISDDIPNEMISDEFRIRQILVNLINNAVKYTDQGTVTLMLGGRFTDDGYELSIIVKDTGKGIRKEDQDKLFDAFSRADVKENVNIEGTGLGLAIVKSIVDSMKGTVGVESEYGVGSEFWVKLPVKYSDKEPLKSDFMENRVEYAEVADASTFTAPDAKVLAVDDNQSNLTIVKLFLKRTGIKPDLCNSGKRAIELCKVKQYDLILLDHMMPQPDGIETLNNIRNDEASLNRETKAVVLTANAVAGSRQMYIDKGFDDYLTKPLDSKLLEQTVMRMLPEEKVIQGEAVSETASDSGDMVNQEIETEKGVETGGKVDGTHGFEEESFNWKDDEVDLSSMDDEVAPYEKIIGSGNSGAEKMSPLKRKLTAIEGLDYEKALFHCGGEEEFLEEIISDIAAECADRAERMRNSLKENDLKAYGIDAHTIKSTMATIGLSKFSERAKKHEFAAKGGDGDFVNSDAEEFINEYDEICKKLEG